MQLKVQLAPEAFMRNLAAYAAVTGENLEKVFRDQFRLVVRNLVELTPPTGSSKKAFGKAQAGALKRAGRQVKKFYAGMGSEKLQFYSAKKFRHVTVKGLGGKQPLYQTKFDPAAFKALKLKKTDNPQRPDDIVHFEQFKRGGVGRRLLRKVRGQGSLQQRAAKVHVPAEQLKAFIAARAAEEMTRAGRVKAAWINACRKFKVPFPRWIKLEKHKRATTDGSAEDVILGAGKIMLSATNANPLIGKLDANNQILQKAFTMQHHRFLKFLRIQMAKDAAKFSAK